MLDCACKHEIIKKSGSWYSYGDDKIGQGKENATKFLEENLAVTQSVEKELREKLFPGKKYVSSFVKNEASDNSTAKIVPNEESESGNASKRVKKDAAPAASIEPVADETELF